MNDFNPNHQVEQQLHDYRRNNPRPLSQSGLANDQFLSHHSPMIQHHSSNMSQSGLTSKLSQNGYSNELSSLNYAKMSNPNGYQHQSHSNQRPSNQYSFDQYYPNEFSNNDQHPSNQQNSDQLSSLNNPINPNPPHSPSDPMKDAMKQFNSRLDMLADRPLLFTTPPTTLKETVSALTTTWITSPYSGNDLNETVREKIIANLEIALATYLSQPNALQSLQAQVPSILSQATNNSKVIIVRPNSVTSPHFLKTGPVSQSNDSTKIVNAQSNPSIPLSPSIPVNDPKVVIAQYNSSIPPPSTVTQEASVVANEQFNSVQSAHTSQLHAPINPSEIQYRRQRHDSFINQHPFQSSPQLPDITPIPMTPSRSCKEDFVTPSHHHRTLSRHSNQNLIPPKISRQIPIASTKPKQQIIDIPIPIALQRSYPIINDDPFWINKINHRVYCNDPYILDPLDEIYPRHTACNLRPQLLDPVYWSQQEKLSNLTNSVMYTLHNMCRCTIATCGYLWFNAHSSDTNNFSLDIKLPEDYQTHPRIDDQLVSDLSHYYHHHTSPQNALYFTKPSIPEPTLITLSEYKTMLIRPQTNQLESLFPPMYQESWQCANNSQEPFQRLSQDAISHNHPNSRSFCCMLRSSSHDHFPQTQPSSQYRTLRLPSNQSTQSNESFYTAPDSQIPLSPTLLEDPFDNEVPTNNVASSLPNDDFTEVVYEFPQLHLNPDPTSSQRFLVSTFQVRPRFPSSILSDQINANCTLTPLFSTIYSAANQQQQLIVTNSNRQHNK